MPGGVIMNPNGTLVYSAEALNFKGESLLRGTVSYQGEDCLAFWVSDGPIVSEGYGSGYNVLVNSSYDVVLNMYVYHLPLRPLTYTSFFRSLFLQHNFEFDRRCRCS